jgi:hypothetical protein
MHEKYFVPPLEMQGFVPNNNQSKPGEQHGTKREQPADRAADGNGKRRKF